jgi:hypothetical protein
VDLLEGLAQTVRHVDHHGLPVPDDIQLPANGTPNTPLARQSGRHGRSRETGCGRRRLTSQC